MKYQIYLIAIIAISFNSCNEKETGKYVCDIVNVSTDQVGILDYGDHFASTKLIPLETNEESLIAQIDKLYYTDDGIIIFDQKTMNIFLFAQDLVSKGLDSIETIFHIKYEMPKGFSNLNTIQSWKPNNTSPWRTLCWVFESGDRQCKLLYNLLPGYPECTCSKCNRMYRELNSVLNTDDFVLDDCLRILPHEEAQKRFNADSIFMYDIPVTGLDTGDGNFIHCTRMFITRQNRPTLDFVWYFTDKGKKKEEKYMQKMNRRIWYNDGNWNPDWQRWDEWMKAYFIEIMDENNKNAIK
jgi:hypothetical protein